MKRIHFALIFLVICLIRPDAWGFRPEDVIREKQSGNKGISKVYPVTEAQAWEIARAALRWEKSNSVEEHNAEKYMLTSFGFVSCPCRTEAGIWIEPVSEDQTKVMIITKGRVYKNIFTNVETFPDVTGPDFQKWFERGVEIVQRGEKLPVSAPKD